VTINDGLLQSPILFNSPRQNRRFLLSEYGLVALGYDSLNRLTSVSYNVGSTGVPATASVTYTYGIDTTCHTAHGAGCIGRVITMTDGVGSENYTIDLLGRTTRLDKVINGTTYTTQYAYNYASELTSLTYPSNRVVSPSYDNIGRLAQVTSGSTNYVSSFVYNPAGQVTSFNYANGVAATMGYTSDRLLLQTLGYAKGTTNLLNLSYGYAAPNGGNNGQITSITDNTGTQDAGRSVTYTFDSLYRLTSAVTTGSTTYPRWGLSWTYDRYGNSTNQTQTAGNPPHYDMVVSASTNRMTAIGGATPAYDASGNLTNDGLNTSITFDAENRTVSSSGTLGSGTYTYDGNGFRVKRISGSTTVYVFSGSKVIAEYDNGAAKIPCPKATCDSDCNRPPIGIHGEDRMVPDVGRVFPEVNARGKKLTDELSRKFPPCSGPDTIQKNDGNGAN
jgi:hypothetical protein